MKALILSKAGQLDVVEMAKPAPADDELLIHIQACGICGSDVHGYDGSTGRRIPPIVMGHEAAGIVESVGSAVSRFQPGDRVTFDSTVFCGKCFFCLRGQVNLCDEREVIGVSTPSFRRMGAFAADPQIELEGTVVVVGAGMIGLRGHTRRQHHADE
jgi:L-iditol 2-dehydrogenase